MDEDELLDSWHGKVGEDELLESWNLAASVHRTWHIDKIKANKNFGMIKPYTKRTCTNSIIHLTKQCTIRSLKTT